MENKRLTAGDFQHENQKEDIEAEGLRVVDKILVIVGISHFKLGPWSKGWFVRGRHFCAQNLAACF